LFIRPSGKSMTCLEISSSQTSRLAEVA